jgi:flavin-dependent dehydrogenase
MTGMAISRALAAAGMKHVLVGSRPTDTPRLGESLNAEGSLEIARQFPELSRFFHSKRRQALFFGGHALSFESLQFAASPAWYSVLGYPATVPLLHVDRVGFDAALFETTIADDHCLFAEDQATGLDYQPVSDCIDAVFLASGQAIASTYVFDATNQSRFVARKLGVRCNRIGEVRRVVFAHYRASDGPAAGTPWMEATSLLRLAPRTDPVEGLAWCIPLGNYASVGISVDPRQTRANPTLLLNWVDKAFAFRGIDVRGAFATRGDPVDHRYEHYTHERCYGRNWLFAGASCCQTWFSSATGVATGLVAARLAADVLRAPAQVPPLYQAFLDRVVASHSGLDWLVRDNPWSVTLEDLVRRSQAMIGGNAKRLSRYLDLQGIPPELAFGDEFPRMYESDRLLATPVRINTALPEAQATRVFAI